VGGECQPTRAVIGESAVLVKSLRDKYLRANSALRSSTNGRAARRHPDQREDRRGVAQLDPDQTPNAADGLTRPSLAAAGVAALLARVSRGPAGSRLCEAHRPTRHGLDADGPGWPRFFFQQQGRGPACIEELLALGAWTRAASASSGRRSLKAREAFTTCPGQLQPQSEGPSPLTFTGGSQCHGGRGTR
jgi:hypothetical protein